MDDYALRRLRHDLRSPLTAIAGFARLLADEGPVSDEQRRQFASHIEAACDQLVRIIDDLGRGED